MGVATNAHLCFGVLLFDKEDEEFQEDDYPWDSEKYEGDFEDWYQDVSGFVPKVESPYNESGNWKCGYEPKRGSKEFQQAEDHWEEYRKWRKEHPCPFELVNGCSDDFPVYILASIKAGIFIANKGYPISIDPVALSSLKEEADKIVGFCKQNNIKIKGQPGWWLSSFYG